MQIVQYSAVSPATPSAIWALYADVENWPDWDAALEWVKWPGPLVVGSTGTMKPYGAPVSKFTMTRCEPDKGFTDVSPMPLARIVFDHVLEVVPEGTRITHSATARGPLGWLFALLIGPAIRRGMPPSVVAIAHQAAFPRKG
jgi:Polyketide cyclase / dehydrase and lipid transport